MSSDLIHPAYQTILDSFPDYSFNNALELFCGKGIITAFLSPRVKRLTCIDKNSDYRNDMMRFHNVAFIPYDALRLVRTTCETQRYDIVDIDCDTFWSGCDGQRIEFYSLVPEIIMMCRKILAVTFVANPFSHDYSQALLSQGLNKESIAGIEKLLFDARVKFWGSELVTNFGIQQVMNREAEKVGKTVELLMHDRFSNIRSRLYFLVN